MGEPSWVRHVLTTVASFPQQSIGQKGLYDTGVVIFFMFKLAPFCKAAGIKSLTVTG
jgi:hypothetical protein